MVFGAVPLVYINWSAAGLIEVLTRTSCLWLHIMIVWKRPGLKFVQVSTVRSSLLMYAHVGKANLVLRIHGYLQRYGFINFGMFSRINPMHGKRKGGEREGGGEEGAWEGGRREGGGRGGGGSRGGRGLRADRCNDLQPPGKMPFKVVVMGAGMSGLMAARQLSYFGLDVTIMEARVRRVCVEGRRRVCVCVCVCVEGRGRGCVCVCVEGRGGGCVCVCGRGMWRRGRGDKLYTAVPAQYK